MFMLKIEQLASRLLVTFTLAGLAVSMAWAHPSAPAAQKPTNEEALDNLQSFLSEGRYHLDPGEKWEYGQTPPTSGPHDPVPIKPGFYKTRQAPEKLVHALEHGNVVIYYEALTPSALRQLKRWATRYHGKWDGIIVTKLPGLGDAIILTAWTKLLRLDFFDPVKALAFMDMFRGHGPENGQNDM